MLDSLFFHLKLYKKSVFKAFEARATAVYRGVNEDCEGESNTENTLLDNCFFVLYKYKSTLISHARRQAPRPTAAARYRSKPSRCVNVCRAARLA